MKNKFDRWLDSATAGQSFVYHRGKYLSKGGAGIEFSDLVFSVREAFEKGLIDLFQRRLEHGITVRHMGRFEWLAVKRATPCRPSVWVSKDGEIVNWVRRPKARAKARG